MICGQRGMFPPEYQGSTWLKINLDFNFNVLDNIYPSETLVRGGGGIGPYIDKIINHYGLCRI